MSFEKLRVYVAAAQFANGVKDLVAGLSYHHVNDGDHLVRAASSVPNNIAEAYGLDRPGRKISHLEIARGSVDEARSLLERLLASGAISRVRALPLIYRARAIAKMLTALIKKLRTMA